MNPSDAIDLLAGLSPIDDMPQHWADLGCGNGTFTQALAHLLPEGSNILAIDKDPQVLKKMPSHVQVRFQKADFDSITLPKGLDGILMANSLHYVSDQCRFISEITAELKPEGALLLVEYNMDQSNPWVPYPIAYERLHQESYSWGFHSIKKIGQRPSRFGRGDLYAAELRKELRKA